MKDPFRNFRMHWHFQVGTKVASVRGVRLATDPSKPKSVRRAIFKRNYEDAEANLLPMAVATGDRVLEIGGGVGFIGILATKRAGEGQVTSYEANPDMAAVIKANYDLNGLVGDVRMKAITGDGRTLTFYKADNVLSSSLVDRDDLRTGRQKIEVPSDSIDAAIDEIAPDVVIMDVEGAEEEVLPKVAARGVARMLVEFHPHIIGQDRTEALKATVLEAGYEVLGASSANILFGRKT